MRPWRVVLAVLVWGAGQFPVTTQASYWFCSEPRKPSCIDQYGTFDNEWSFRRCRDSVEDYLDDVSEFQSCLANWHEDIGKEADKLVDRFNCKARQELFCP